MSGGAWRSEGRWPGSWDESEGDEEGVAIEDGADGDDGGGDGRRGEILVERRGAGGFEEGGGLIRVCLVVEEGVGEERGEGGSLTGGGIARGEAVPCGGGEGGGVWWGGRAGEELFCEDAGGFEDTGIVLEGEGLERREGGVAADLAEFAGGGVEDGEERRRAGAAPERVETAAVEIWA